MPSVIRRNGNPTLLSLLSQGCTIRWDDGRSLSGDPKTGYIKIARNDAALGLYSLDRDGLRRALSDRDFRSDD
jgi:hypothetical protein